LKGADTLDLSPNLLHRKKVPTIFFLNACAEKKNNTSGGKIKWFRAFFFFLFILQWSLAVPLTLPADRGLVMPNRYATSSAGQKRKNKYILLRHK